MTTIEPDTLRLAAIVGASDDAIISHSPDGVIETWNRAAERMFGYSAAEAIGRPVDLIVAPACWAEERRLRDQLRQGLSVQHFETLAVTRDGATLSVSLALSPLITPGGDILGAVRVARDISRQKTTERELARLAAIVDSADDAIISKDLNGVILTWNTAAEKLFGYRAEEIVGHSITRIIPVERYAEEVDVLGRVSGGERVEHYETVRQRKDGSLVDVSLTVSPIRTADGAIIGASKIARDITLRRHLEQEAFRLAAVVASSDDAIISKDLNGIVRTWNPAAERMFGFTADEIVGRSITMIIPAERLGEEDTVLARVRSGRSIDHFETVRRRKDGGLIEISLSVSPVRTPDGVVIGASKIARDVSRQRMLEREALRLAAVVNSSDDAIVSKDLNGIVQTWNSAAERLFGYTADEMIGRSIAVIIPAERLPEEDEVLRRIRAGLSVDHFETVRQRKDGTFVDISLTVSPITSANGRVIGASKIARDISAQRRLTRAAEDANRVKDEFLAMLSHELRTPLNAVLGYTRMLRGGIFSRERHERAIDTIERNANILSQLVSDVLDVSTIVTGKVQLKLARHDLARVTAAAVDVVRPTADTKGIGVTLQAPETPLWARCDADRVQQILWNLLVNAAKFTPGGGQIRVAVEERTGGRACIVVSDTGVGISPESLPYVFQRFWQGEQRAEHATGGLGLGLALARHFAELHGGTIAARSEGEGRGATFTVTLPLAIEEQPAGVQSDRQD